jgi:hypothetical protein
VCLWGFSGRVDCWHHSRLVFRGFGFMGGASRGGRQMQTSKTSMSALRWSCRCASCWHHLCLGVEVGVQGLGAALLWGGGCIVVPCRVVSCRAGRAAASRGGSQGQG